MPSMEGTCPAAIVMAEPVMNPAIAGTGMNSTMKPRRNKPMPNVMAPQSKARAVAISGFVNSFGLVFCTCAMTRAT